MEKLKTSKDLESLRNSILQSQAPDMIRVRICMTGCRAYGAEEIRDAFEREIEKAGLQEKVEIVDTGCHGFCAKAPVLAIDPLGVFYQQLVPDDVPEIVSRTIMKGEVIERLVYEYPETGERIPKAEDIPFYKKQTRLVLHNCGMIDPKNIEHYIARDGYSALAKVLSDLSGPEEVTQWVKDSGLRGRGGAGFPTGLKWDFARMEKSEDKYIICNADEGDPGAFMDRAVLEGDPHAVIEGLIIGAYAIGAHNGYIYVRAEYPIAVEHLEIAVKQAEELGLLGEDILGSGFNFNIIIMEGAGAFVCGEETALMASIEGKRGSPRPRPPFPANSGLWGKPTNINNVETLANIPHIFLKGADWYSSIGTDNSKGTKVFALAGKVNNTGLVEVPMGITLREVIFDIGGGIPDGKKFKAVQIGGPSGGCIPIQHLDLPIDYDSLSSVGAIMGSGGMIVMDEDSCMVDVARYFMDFIQSESCGKCVPCRLGTDQMLQILTKITEGKGKESDLELLEEMALTVKKSSLCALGQTAPNSVLSTLNFFRDEYEAHVNQKRCPANECKELVSSSCQHVCPIDTEASVYIALIAEGRLDEAWEVIRKDNPLPSICARVCDHQCEINCRSGKWGEPISVRALKRYVTDYAMRTGIYDFTDEPPVIDKEPVAVIGSGPAGLTAGYHLARKGYDVTIFEAEETPGGTPAIHIPEYRLPMDILSRDIENIKKAGAKIETNTRIGRDISFEELMEKYASVFISTGAHKQMKLNIPGEDAHGVLYALNFLKAVKLNPEVTAGRRIGIIGGGNSAIDSARCAIRLDGCEEVTMIYRRTRAEMPAYDEEIEAAIEEGIRIQYLAMPESILTKDGKITGLECIKAELGDMDESGRRRPVPVEGSEFVIELDTLILAIGERAELDFLNEDDGVAMNKNGTVAADPEVFRTNVDGVFVGGDVRTNPDTVVQAMHAGKVAAEMMDKYIRGEEIAREYEFTRPSTYIPPVELTEEEISDAKRPEMPTLLVEERVKNFREVDLGLTDEMARMEARRCLRCELETRDAKIYLERLKAAVTSGV